mgnify:FL=1
MDSAQVAEQVAAGKADIGFTGTVLEKKHCQYIPFYKDHLVITTPDLPKYRELQKREEEIFWIQDEK